jgi:glycosyltransferase involved in cell wall biosynthesis
MELAQPAVAHFHNTFHRVSPSGYWAARAASVPVVQTLRNYRIVCCNAQLFRQGAPCEDCIGKRIPWQGVVRGCYRRSVAASLAVATVTTLHRATGTWTNCIDVYVAPSEFVRSKFIEAGFPASKIVVKPNFVHPDPGVGLGEGGFALFAGRLSAEKGVHTLLDAWRQLGKDVPLRIVGDGPLADEVRAAARHSHIEWLGRRPTAEVYELMGKARCVVVPSEWYETFGRVVVEALAKGTPAVVSDAGVPRELVRDGLNGFHFRSRDPLDLSRAIRSMFDPALDVAAMRARARREYEDKYTCAANYETLMSIYERAIRAKAGLATDGVSAESHGPTA